MQISTKGLIIREIKTGEADRMVHILTEKLGVISAVSRGGRNIKNRLVGSTSLLTFSEFQLFKKGQIYIIDSGDSIQGFHQLKGDIYRVSLAMYFCQVADFLAPKEEEAKEFLRLLLNTLHFLGEGTLSKAQLKFTYEMKVMGFTGYTPDFTGCRGCRKLETSGYYFDGANGNILCTTCYPNWGTNGLIPLNQTMFQSMKYVTEKEMGQIFSFQIKEETGAQLTRISEEFLRYHWDKNFTTLDFYKNL